jgi:hypothetical protein
MVRHVAYQLCALFVSAISNKVSRYIKVAMSDQVKEILDIPRDFFKDGAFFLNRCTKPNKRGMIPFQGLWMATD